MSSSRDAVRNTLALCTAALVIGLVAAPALLRAQTRTNAVAPQSSSDRGVTIEVIPRSIGPGARLWEFSIQLHTHSSGVSDDLTQSAVLVTDDGRILNPLGWSDTRLGPHREGLLSFEAPTPLPRGFELRITRPGEAAPRSFRWQL